MTLLQTKLTPPAPIDGTISRPRLSQALARTSKPVALISAPAGYGKTTTVAQGLTGASTPVAWLRIDRADNDPVRFWRHLAGTLASAGQLDQQTRDDIADSLESGRLQDAVDDLLIAVDETPESAVLVLDDVHEITNPTVLDPLSDALLRPPNSLKIVLVTRADPALPLGRLRANDALFELRAADLAFNASEVSELLGDLAEPDTIDPVVQRTQGWATAVRMLAVAANEPDELKALLHAASNDSSDLASYLSGEVLERQDPRTRNFLVRTSIVDELTPDLCDVLTQRSDGLSTLRQLARTHVFTETITPTSFRYHPLFRDFLLARFDELPADERRRLHGYAAAHLSDIGDSSGAIRHHLEADRRQDALEEVRANWVRYAQQGLWATIDQWINDYGPEAARRDEELSLAAAWLALNTRRYDQIDFWIDDRSDPSINFQIQAASLRAYRARHEGDITAAIQHGERSFALLDHDLDAPAASTALTAHASAQALNGNPDTAAFETALELGTRNDMIASVVEARSFLALLYTQNPDRTESAREHIEIVQELTRSPADERFHQPAAAWLAAARVARHEGRLADAARDATRALNIAIDAIEPALVILAECERAIVAHAQGDTTSARAAHRRANKVLRPESGALLAEHVRRTGNAIRYAHPEANADLPIGARELTDRELAVIRNLDNDLTRTQLAEQLYITENTLKSHLASIGRKLGVRKRREIVERAIELGFLGET